MIIETSELLEKGNRQEYEINIVEAFVLNSEQLPTYVHLVQIGEKKHNNAYTLEHIEIC